MKKETAQRLLDIGEMIIVIGSAFYVVNLLGVTGKWILPTLCGVYAVGAVLAIVGKIGLKKYAEPKKTERKAA